MRELLVKEIQRVQEVEGDFVDTEFYTGFVQREYKPDYLARLKADLAEAYEAEKAALDVSEEDQEKAKSRWKTSALGTMGARAFAEAAPEPEEEEDEETLMERAVPDYARKGGSSSTGSNVWKKVSKRRRRSRSSASRTGPLWRGRWPRLKTELLRSERRSIAWPT